MKAFTSGFKLTALACLLGLSSLHAVAADHWNMTVEQPDGNYLTETAKTFAKSAAEASNGALEIRVHTNSVLFKRPEVKRAVQTGQVQVGEMLMATLGNEDPIFEVDSVPFLARSFPEAQKLWLASKPAVEARLAKQGIRLLYAVPWPPQSVFTQVPINSMADFKGMKFRAYSPATSRMAELMGAVPTTINTGEIPQAFSTGMITGMLTSPATGVDTQAWDFSKYYYDVKAFIPKNFVIVNERAFKRLPEAAQKAVLDAAQKAEASGWTMAQEKTAALVKTLGDNGMQISETSPADVEEGFKKIADTMAQDWLSKTGQDGKAIMDAFRQ